MAEPHHARRQAAQTLLTVLTVAALGLVAIWPLFRQPALACTDDLGFHLLRLTQLDHLLDNGILYSRWAPDMALGYGFPFFNFYAPLAYYLAAAVSALGPGLNLGMRLTFALGILGAGLATYRLARDHFSRPAALAAAAAVMYAPYHGYDVYFRGNLAESLAWPFLALALWAIGRLARRGGGIWLPLAALAAAAVLLIHNVFALIFLPLLGLYGTAEAWFGNDEATTGNVAGRGARWRRLGMVVGALLLALSLSAFFWLPAMWEQRYVHIDRLLVPPDFVYWNNFITPGELFTLPRRIQPDLLNPSPPRGLGLLPALLALPALWGLWRWRDGRRHQVAFFGAALLLYAFAMTAASEPIWSSIPLLQFIQFPWRLLGPAAICLAMLIAAGVELGVEALGRRFKAGGPLVAAGTIALLVLASLFWFDPRYCGGLEEPEISALAAYEQASDTIGTTAKGEYLPRTVRLYPPPPVPAPGRFAAATLPEGVQLLEQSDAPLRASAVVEAAAPAQLVANVFAYPGWRAQVDGEAVPITPEADFGRIKISLPAGRHEIILSFGETPLRLAADLVSALALLALVLLLWRARWQRTVRPVPPGSRLHPGFLLLGLALFGLVAGLLPRVGTPLRGEVLQEGALPGVQAPRDVHFVGGMQWLGFNTRAEQPVPADRAVRYDLFWMVASTPAANYQSTLHLIGPDGQSWSAKDTIRPRDFRAPPLTSAWPPGQFAQDSHLLAPLPGTPPGRYDVRLLLFDRQSLQPVAPQESRGREAQVGQLEISRPARRATLAELRPQYPAHTVWGPLRLLGYDLDRGEAAPGEPFLLTLFWQAEEAPAEAYTIQLTLLAADGEAVLMRRRPPVRADFPTTDWQAGDTWRGQHPLRLPPGLESGPHRWQLVLCRGDGNCEPMGDPLDLGMLEIQAPERRFDIPDVTLPLSEQLGGLATLVGADLEPDYLAAGGDLTVTLVWRAEAETGTSYRAFLHLLGPQGEIVSQSDGEPANWTRPTTGWLAGEVILDERRLALPAELPAGDYRLVAGLYDLESGGRLALPNGDDAALITLFRVEP